MDHITFKTLGTLHPVTEHHIPEDWDLLLHMGVPEASAESQST
jgi:hypothetical protein